MATIGSMRFPTRGLLLVLVAFCFAPAAGCRSAAQDDARSGYALCARGVTRTSEGILRVCAPINAETVSEVRRQITDQDSEVILTSGGGFSYDAMDLARLFNAHDLTIRVRQFCLSACSTYVLLTAKRVVIEPYAMVAFHHTGAFAADVMVERFDLAADSPLRQLSADERSFFRLAGLDPSLLDRLAMAVDPKCIAVSTDGQGKRMGVLHYAWPWFMPDPAEAAELFRERQSGYWPKTREEAQAILRPTIGQPSANVRFGWPEITASSPAAIAASIPTCLAQP